jgi:hypothetical protein
MNFWKKLFGSKQSRKSDIAAGASSTPTATFPAERLGQENKPVVNATTGNLPMPTEDKSTNMAAAYVEAVFSFDLANKPEPRDWRDLAELSDVPDLHFDKKFAQLEATLQDALAKFSDYSFVHSWRGTLFQDRGEIGRAREAFSEGIQVSNEKHGLCGDLAMLELKHGTLKEAVKWWIRSILLQMPRKSVNDAQPFLYLAFVAHLYQLNGAYEKLMNASSKGMHGAIALSPKGKQDLSQKVNAQEGTEIPAAIQELTTRRWTGF